MPTTSTEPNQWAQAHGGEEQTHAAPARREVLRRGMQAALGAVVATSIPLQAFAHGAAPHIEVWRMSDCTCCEQWTKHLQNYFFMVQLREVPDLTPVRQALGMPQSLAACHTARIEGYVIEGHVPALDILRLTRERPSALGLAVPDMPLGSPGMEHNGPKDGYDVLLVARDGSTSVFKSYR